MLENGMVLVEPGDMPDVYCPECGEACDTLYKRDGEILGCENCIYKVDAYDELQTEDDLWNALDDAYDRLRDERLERMFG